jgi:prophage antirepressor-like protein
MKELMFQDTSLRVIERDGRQWVGAADIARALGYSEAGKVTRLYDRHRVEFSENMTQIFEMPTLGVSGNLSTKSRFFSLRGAHLVAMFARTSKGQEFRRWVLDLLDAQDNKKKSPIQMYYEARAEEQAQAKFASMCGRGLNEHKHVMPPLRRRSSELLHELQPALPL